MTSSQFNQWLAAMKAAGHIRFDKDAYEALGLTRDTFHRFKRDGTQRVETDYACAALLAGLPPYPGGPN